MTAEVDKCIVCGEPTDNLSPLCVACWDPVDSMGVDRSEYIPLVPFDQNGDITALAFVLRESFSRLSLPDTVIERVDTEPFLALPSPLYDAVLALLTETRSPIH